MKKGDRIIFDSGSGYEIGYFEEIPNILNTSEVVIEFRSGTVHGRKGIVWKTEVKPYSKELVKELTAKYGYEKAFSEVF